MSTTGFTVSGYTCQTCGAWVPNGTIHQCYHYSGGLASLSQQWQMTALNGIWAELQKIRELLEKLVAK